MPFGDLSGYAIAGIFVVYFFAYFIRGTLGFGSAMPAVLGGVWVLNNLDLSDVRLPSFLQLSER